MNENNITKEEIDTAFEVIESMREESMKENLEPETTVFNDCHHFMQEMQGYWVENNDL